VRLPVLRKFWGPVLWFAEENKVCAYVLVKFKPLTGPLSRSFVPEIYRTIWNGVVTCMPATFTWNVYRCLYFRPDARCLVTHFFGWCKGIFFQVIEDYELPDIASMKSQFESRGSSVPLPMPSGASVKTPAKTRTTSEPSGAYRYCLLFGHSVVFWKSSDVHGSYFWFVASRGENAAKAACYTFQLAFVLLQHRLQSQWTGKRSKKKRTKWSWANWKRNLSRRHR